MALTPKNWDTFQHYKNKIDGAALAWIKVYRKLLDDPDWHALDGDAAKMLVECWLVAAENNGKLPKLSRLAFRLRKSEKQVSAMLSMLSHWIEDDSRLTLESVYDESTQEKEEEKSKSKKDSAPTRARLPKSYLPDEWKPSEPLTPHGDAELEKMRDWARSNGVQKADWAATFRNWCRRAGGQCIMPEANRNTAPMFFAADDSPQRRAWDEYGKRNGISYPSSPKRGGWDFPSEWPPGHREVA